MIALSEADDLQKVIANVERDTGRDMTAMRAIADEVMALEVGDPTPAPGTLIVEPEPLIVFPPPMHEGWSMPPDGKFLIPFSPASATTRQVRRLSRRVSRLAFWLTGLTMCFISAVVVVAYKW